MRILALLLVMLGAATVAHADPCGMVPPVYLGENGSVLKRIGPQKTYVFFKDGVEDIVLRPGYSGNVEEFGMLVALPSNPALRKVPDEIFSHLAAAVDPPEVVIDLRPIPPPMPMSAPMLMGAGGGAAEPEMAVRVLKQEAVGMYEVAVLEAGSAKGLEKWMTEHKFKYPAGMDTVVNDYVKEKWCFVAVKTRIAEKGPTNPQPGMKKVPAPPSGPFDGYIQGMGFRFTTPSAVVPMRLATYNAADDRRQVVYALTTDPVKFDRVPDATVRRQLAGAALHRNVTGPLPLRILGGQLADVPKERLEWIRPQRDPAPHNGHAKELFAGDLHAAKTKDLSMPHEEEEKELLNIGERLKLRGPEVDALHAESLSKAKEELAKGELAALDKMTLTIIDGEFPFEVMQKSNLVLTRYEMAKAKNNAVEYDANQAGKGWRQTEGVVIEGDVDPATKKQTGATPGNGQKKGWYESLWGN